NRRQRPAPLPLRRARRDVRVRGVVHVMHVTGGQRRHSEGEGEDDERGDESARGDAHQQDLRVTRILYEGNRESGIGSARYPKGTYCATILVEVSVAKDKKAKSGKNSKPRGEIAALIDGLNVDLQGEFQAVIMYRLYASMVQGPYRQ